MYYDRAYEIKGFYNLFWNLLKLLGSYNLKHFREHLMMIISF